MVKDFHFLFLQYEDEVLLEEQLAVSRSRRRDFEVGVEFI